MGGVKERAAEADCRQPKTTTTTAKIHTRAAAPAGWQRKNGSSSDAGRSRTEVNASARSSEWEHCEKKCSKQARAIGIMQTDILSFVAQCKNFMNEPSGVPTTSWQKCAEVASCPGSGQSSGEMRILDRRSAWEVQDPREVKIRWRTNATPKTTR